MTKEEIKALKEGSLVILQHRWDSGIQASLEAIHWRAEYYHEAPNKGFKDCVCPAGFRYDLEDVMAPNAQLIQALAEQYAAAEKRMHEAHDKTLKEMTEQWLGGK
jgi:hypothetical protein